MRGVYGNLRGSVGAVPVASFVACQVTLLQRAPATGGFGVEDDLTHAGSLREFAGLVGAVPVASLVAPQETLLQEHVVGASPEARPKPAPL